jgi:hypothetical protein
MEAHGCHGPSYHFVQDGGPGGYLTEPSTSGRYTHDISVQATRKRRRPADGPSIDQLLVNKVRELIETGKLRDPAIVRAKQEQRAVDLAREREQQDAQEQKEFEERAEQAIRSAHYKDDPRLRDEIIAAIRWAQTK